MRRTTRCGGRASLAAEPERSLLLNPDDAVFLLEACFSSDVRPGLLDARGKIRRLMTSPEPTAVDTWRINRRITTFLVQNLPPAIWASALPGSPRRTVRGIAARLHNSRRLWMRSLAAGTTIPIPRAVDPRAVTRRDLVVIRPFP